MHLGELTRGQCGCTVIFEGQRTYLMYKTVLPSLETACTSKNRCVPTYKEESEANPSAAWTQPLQTSLPNDLPFLQKAFMQAKTWHHPIFGRDQRKEEEQQQQLQAVCSEWTNHTIRLACALCYFAGGSPYDIMTSYNIGYTDMIQSVWCAVDAFNAYSDFQILYPADHERQYAIAESF